MREVVLHGRMGEIFGKSFTLDVVSIVDVARALGAQLKGFRKYLTGHNYEITVIRDDNPNFECEAEHVEMNLPNGAIHIRPVVAGAKSGGVGKIIAGLFIAVFAFWALPAIAGTTLAATAIGGISATQIGIFGLAIAAAGIAQLLTKTPKPKTSTQAQAQNDSSYSIDGALNVTEQGGPVPLAYGRFMVGSTLISAGLTTTDYSVAAGAAAVAPPTGGGSSLISLLGGY